MTNTTPAPERAPEVSWFDRNWIGKFFYAPQALVTSITGNNGLLGRAASFFTNPWVLATGLTLAGGYHFDLFNKLGDQMGAARMATTDIADTAGQTTSFGAQNFYNWLQSRHGVGWLGGTNGEMAGPVGRLGQSAPWTFIEGS